MIVTMGGGGGKESLLFAVFSFLSSLPWLGFSAYKTECIVRRDLTLGERIAHGQTIAFFAP